MWWFVAVALVGCAGAQPVTAPNGQARHHDAIIDHTWPTPRRLPELPAYVHSGLDRPILVVPPLGPQRAAAASKPERDRLAKLVATAKGTALLAALDRLADALESDRDDALEKLPDPPSADPIIAAYAELIAKPGFATYAKADEVLFRAAHVMFDDGRLKEANDVATQLFTMHPTSRLVADMHVLVADSLSNDPALARAHYEEAMAVGRKSIVDYARLRHAWMLTLLGQFAGALDECDLIAASDALYRQVAAQTCITAFAEGGALANARDYFTRLDPDSIEDSMRRLAREYGRLGKVEDAIALIEDTLPHLTEWEEICDAHVRLFEARMFAGARVPMLVDAKRLADAAQHTTVCRNEADDQLGQVAWSWQMELPKSEADPRQVDEMWQHELAVVTTDARRAVALLDRAYLAWQLARSERRPAAWDRAAAALQAAYDADHDSVDAGAIAAAHANAAALRTSP